YLAERGRPQTPHELSGHDCITFLGQASLQTWIFEIERSDISIPVHSRLAVNTAEAAIDAAIAGTGITRVLSYQIADAVRTGTLEVILDEYEPAPFPVSLVHAGQGLLPAKLRSFLDFAAPRLKARLAEEIF